MAIVIALMLLMCWGQRRQFDWITGLEIRLAAIRIHGAFRTLGPITRSAFDLRLFYRF